MNSFFPRSSLRAASVPDFDVAALAELTQYSLVFNKTEAFKMGNLCVLRYDPVEVGLYGVDVTFKSEPGLMMDCP